MSCAHILGKLYKKISRTVFRSNRLAWQNKFLIFCGNCFLTKLSPSIFKFPFNGGLNKNKLHAICPHSNVKSLSFNRQPRQDEIWACVCKWEVLIEITKQFSNTSGRYLSPLLYFAFQCLPFRSNLRSHSSSANVLFI